MEQNTPPPAEEPSEEQQWQTAVCHLAVMGAQAGFLSDKGLRTIQFMHENTIYSISVSALPSNIIPMPK